MSTIFHLNTEAARFDPASVFARFLDIPDCQPETSQFSMKSVRHRNSCRSPTTRSDWCVRGRCGLWAPAANT